MAEDDLLGGGRPISVPQVKALLEREQAAREDLSYEQKLGLDHASTFARLPADQAEELVQKLIGLGGRVTAWHAHKILDLAPTHVDDVRAIFQKDRVTPEPEEIEKIIEIVQNYL